MRIALLTALVALAPLGACRVAAAAGVGGGGGGGRLGRGRGVRRRRRGGGEGGARGGHRRGAAGRGGLLGARPVDGGGRESDRPVLRSGCPRRAWRRRRRASSSPCRRNRRRRYPPTACKRHRATRPTRKTRPRRSSPGGPGSSRLSVPRRPWTRSPPWSPPDRPRCRVRASCPDWTSAVSFRTSGS